MSHPSAILIDLETGKETRKFDEKNFNVEQRDGIVISGSSAESSLIWAFWNNVADGVTACKISGTDSFECLDFDV